MIPIVFPHTYLPSRMMQILPLVFPRVGVYLPSDLDIPMQMQQWADSGILELRIPVIEDTEQLASVLKAFRSWASLQGGSPGIDLSLLKAYHSQAPFLDAPFSTQIRADIRHRMASPVTEPPGQHPEPDRLFSARVFLSIAQQLDEQADTLDRDFAAVNARQQDMLQQLQSDDPSVSPASGHPSALPVDAHAQHMLAERLEAWSRLAAADPAHGAANAPALFVTGSREVSAQMVDLLPEGAAFDPLGSVCVPVETSDRMAGWRRDLAKTIASLTAGRPERTDADIELPAPPPVAPGQDSVLLEVIRIPHRRIADVLGFATASHAAADPGRATAANTVIVTVGPVAEFSG